MKFEIRQISRAEFWGYIVLSIFIVFTILKIRGDITWSWWWVTSPLWIPLILNIFAMVAIYTVLYVMKKMIKKSEEKFFKDLDLDKDLKDIL